MYSASYLSTGLCIFNHIVLMDLVIIFQQLLKIFRYLSALLNEVIKACNTGYKYMQLNQENCQERVNNHPYPCMYSTMGRTRLDILGFTTSISQPWMLQWNLSFLWAYCWSHAHLQSTNNKHTSCLLIVWGCLTWPFQNNWKHCKILFSSEYVVL